jgi:hypothetical protein|tara:strand:- start:360 stop:1163 length:804 start_codon:yes stop_codon:yes gene_type:complete
MIRLTEILKEENYKVLGYVRPAESFHTLAEWQKVVEQFLALQKQGYDTRGGNISNNPKLVKLINKYFSYQLNVEVERYDLLTTKNVLDFIEDFVNHRFWSIDEEYGHYFPDIYALKFAYFYSRGDIEPYVMLDENYTMQLYKSLDNKKVLNHYVSPDGLKRLHKAIKSGNTFDISTFTVAERPFFRPGSTLIIQLIGNVKAGFKSDIKSYALDNGRRACNLYRLGYPGTDETNICYELDSCNGEIKTSLWNEYIAEPIKIIGVKENI